MVRTAVQSAAVGAVASAGALWARFGAHWWPASPLEKGAYRTMCPACPYDAAGALPAREAIGLVILCATIYALLGVGIEIARKMRIEGAPRPE